MSVASTMSAIRLQRSTLWHMDSHDKLKPYGVAINGCNDGFSCHIMWMEAYTTSTNPTVVAD